MRLPRRGDEVANKYRVEHEIGRGSSGAVYLARHLVTHGTVALKWLAPRGVAGADEMERFLREARAAARVRHPNIVDVYDVGEDQGSLFMVMEYLHGMPLRRAMRGGPLPPGPALRALLPVLRGLHAAHREGIVHRDLKPDNIFLVFGEDGEALDAKVLDFGISKLVGSNKLDVSLTETGTLLGTPHYMAPEQAEDPRSVDARADIYSFGVVLYQALSGRRPYDGETLASLLLQITRGRAVPLHEVAPQLPRALCDVVMRAMAPDPARRFADARALASALEPFASEAGTATGLVQRGVSWPAAVDADGMASTGGVRGKHVAAEPATSAQTDEQSEETPFGTLAPIPARSRAKDGRALRYLVALGTLGLTAVGLAFFAGADPPGAALPEEPAAERVAGAQAVGAPTSAVTPDVARSEAGATIAPDAVDSSPRSSGSARPERDVRATRDAGPVEEPARPVEQARFARRRIRPDASVASEHRRGPTRRPGKSSRPAPTGLGSRLGVELEPAQF